MWTEQIWDPEKRETEGSDGAECDSLAACRSPSFSRGLEPGVKYGYRGVDVRAVCGEYAAYGGEKQGRNGSRGGQPLGSLPLAVLEVLDVGAPGAGGGDVVRLAQSRELLLARLVRSVGLNVLNIA
jgi:hypothetical protein